MENFNKKYMEWKQSMVDMINNSGIPLAVVDDFLTTLKTEIGRTLAQEQMVHTEEEKDAEEVV